MLKILQKIQIMNINRFLLSVLMFIAFFFVITARRPDILYHPQLWAEDGAMWLAEAYNRGLYSLLFPQNGYFQTISKVTLYVALFFGLSKAALIANIIAISIRCFLMMFILSSRLSFIHILYRIAAVIYFIFMPNLTEGYVNITNVQWYLSLYLFTIIFAKDANNFIWKLHDFVILIIAGLSGPFVIFLLPCLFIKRVVEQGGLMKAIKGINVFDIILMLCFIIQLLTIILTVDPNTRSSAPLGASFSLFVKIISVRIVLGTFFSNYMVTLVADKEYFSFLKGWFSFLLFFIFILGIFKIIKSSGWRFWISFLFPLLVISFALAKPMINMTLPQWPFFLEAGTAERYFFITNFAFFCFVLYVISFLGKYAETALYSLMICMVPLFFLNFSMPPLEYVGFREDIHKFNTLKTGQEMFIRINPRGWFMILKKK